MDFVRCKCVDSDGRSGYRVYIGEEYAYQASRSRIRVERKILRSLRSSYDNIQSHVLA